MSMRTRTGALCPVLALDHNIAIFSSGYEYRTSLYETLSSRFILGRGRGGPGAGAAAGGRPGGSTGAGAAAGGSSGSSPPLADTADGEGAAAGKGSAFGKGWPLPLTFLCSASAICSASGAGGKLETKAAPPCIELSLDDSHEAVAVGLAMPPQRTSVVRMPYLSWSDLTRTMFGFGLEGLPLPLEVEEDFFGHESRSCLSSGSLSSAGIAMYASVRERPHCTSSMIAEYATAGHAMYSGPYVSRKRGVIE